MANDFQEYGVQIVVGLPKDHTDPIVKELIEFNYQDTKRRVFPKWDGEPEIVSREPDFMLFEGGRYRLAFEDEVPNARGVYWKAKVPTEFVIITSRSEYELMVERHLEAHDYAFPYTEEEWEAI